MTFGSAVTADDVPAYLASVRGGRPVPDEVIAEFRRRYERIGRSPLIDITLAQAAALQAELDRRWGVGSHLVAVGMQHSAPRIGAAVSNRSSFNAWIFDIHQVFHEQQESQLRTRTAKVPYPIPEVVGIIWDGRSARSQLALRPSQMIPTTSGIG